MNGDELSGTMGDGDLAAPAWCAPAAAHDRAWFMELWSAVCELRIRYRLPIRSAWWEDSIQLEALAALAEWLERYDSGEWDDPPGKLALLFELERIAVLLRDGGEPFHPERDRPAYDAHLRRHFGLSE